MATLNIDFTKIVMGLAALIVTITTSFGAYFINDIRTSIQDLKVTVDTIKDTDLPAIRKDIHELDKSALTGSYTFQSIVKDISRLEDNIEALERRIP